MQINYGKSWYIDGDQSIFSMLQGNSINSIQCVTITHPPHSQQHWQITTNIFVCRLLTQNQYWTRCSILRVSILFDKMHFSCCSITGWIHLVTLVEWKINHPMYGKVFNSIVYRYRWCNFDFDVVIFTSITITLNGENENKIYVAD